MSYLRDLVNKDLKKLPAKDVAASYEYLKKANVALKKGNLGNAVIFYEAAVRLDPDNQEARDAASSTNTKVGDKLFSSENTEDLRAAVKFYKNALDLNPNNTTIRDKLERTLEDTKFQSQVKVGTPDFYLGVKSSMLKSEIESKARDIVRDRIDSFLNATNFKWSEYCRELDVEASKFITNHLEDRKKYYQREFNEPNFDSLYTRLPEFSGICNSEFKTVSYSLGTLYTELRPYEVSSFSARSLCDDYHEQEVGEIFNIDKTKIRRLETYDRIVRKISRQGYGRVYYFENYVVPFATTLRYHIEVPIRFTYGFKKYGLVRDKLSLDFEAKVKGNIIYDGNQGKIIEQELTGAELMNRMGIWKGYRYVSPGSQLKEDIFKAGFIGMLVTLLPGGCIEGCHNLITGQQGGFPTILTCALVFGAIVGVFVGFIRFFSRSSWAIKSIHDDWVEKHPYNK